MWKTISFGFAAINLAAAGVTQVVAAPGAGYRIVPLSYVFSTNTAANFQWLSAATALSGPMPAAVNGGFSVPESTQGLMVCGDNEALNLGMSGAGAVVVGGHLSYAVQQYV